MLKKNEIRRSQVTGFTSEGLGVCRVDGCAVFVANAAPGEVYDLRITHVGKTAAYAKIETIITKSPHRVNRKCPWAKLCGGCDFWHITYEAELEIKAQRVLDALNRIGGQNLDQMPITGALNCEGYRNKAQFPVAMGKKSVEAGFYQKGSHDLIPVDRCLIQPEVADRAKAAVLEWAKTYRIAPYEESTHKGLLRHIFVRYGAATGELLVCLVVNGEKVPREAELIAHLREKLPTLRSLALNCNTRKGNAILGDRTRILWGAEYIEDVLCGLRFRISPRSFYQVNRDQAEKLYEKAVSAAGLTGKETVLDLYCGTGTITLCLAQKAEKAIGVEIIDAAIVDAKENAKRNGIDNALFFCADAGQAAQKFSEEGIRPDVIVVDPPRKGLSPDVIEAVARMSPTKVVYVSCDPATLARDVKLLCEKGYSLSHAEAVDMFPRCSHVESVVCLSREKADESEKESNMISDERSKYKSWSNLKKQMNNLLCDSLKDKITYFYTSYHEVNNAYGRATINCNKKELVAFSWDIGYAKWDDEYTVLNETNVNIQTLGSFQAVWDEQKRVQEELNKSKWMQEGKLCETDFINAVTTYLKTDIAAALRSDNYLLRIFAYMDRRVGKRTLVKIQDEVEKLPDWVKQFYQIRCEADGNVFPPKRIIDESIVCLTRD